MRRLHQALLLALLLLAVQTAALTHVHDPGAPTTGPAAQSCEFCVGHAAAAPPRDPPSTPSPDCLPAHVPDLDGVVAVAVRFTAAHRSRAPPRFHSV